MKKLFLKNWRDIIKHKPQFIALIVIVALGITSFIASIGAYENLFFSYNHAYEKLRFADFTVEIEAAPKDVVEKIKRLKEVESLEKHFADYYKKRPGQYVQPIIRGHRQKMRIAGIVSSPEYLIATPSKQDILPSARRFAVIFLPQEKLEKLFGIENQINEVSILVKKDSDRASVVKKVEEILRPYGVVETITKEEQPSNAALKLDLEGYREIAYLMPTLILIIAARSGYWTMNQWSDYQNVRGRLKSGQLLRVLNTAYKSRSS